jgi:nitric oxide reductase NorD protein
MRAGPEPATSARAPSAPADAIEAAWRQLDCALPGVRAVFDACAPEAYARLSASALHGYWGGARQLGKLGRGAQPVLAWLTYWPEVLEAVGSDHAQDALDAVTALLHRMHKSPNSAAMAPLLSALGPVAQRLGSIALLQQFLLTVGHFMDHTTGSIHGRQATQASPGLVAMLEQSPLVLQQLSLSGWQAWVDFGARVYATHPPQQADYFALRSPDSRAVMQRERHGTLLRDVERTLGLTLQALCGMSPHLTALPTPLQASGEALHALPCWQGEVMGLPDVLDARNGVSALDRYRLMVLHMATHAHISSACIADNWSPAQRLAVEWFEDTRVDLHMMRQWPGLARAMRALYPNVQEADCDESTHACLLHRLSVWSRAVLDPMFVVHDATLVEWVQRFQALMAQSAVTTAQVAQCALQFVARTRRPSDAQAQVHFAGTHIDWRDDNRHLWLYIEDGDEEDTQPSRARPDAHELHSLPPQLYPEWDYLAQCERPDWVRVFESLQPAGDTARIERMMQRHASLAKRLAKVLDALQPQGRTRQRHLEHGTELDLDLALNAYIDQRTGHTPSHRLEQRTRPVERDISVQLVMDLSASLRERAPGGEQTLLDISQESVAMLAWSLNRLGDPLAIGGFHSNTRHEVRYVHIKGFDEAWDDTPKARLAGLEPGWSTRMGAALRHAGRTLQRRQSDKKLMLVLTDGEPSDVDVSDPQWLAADAHKAVQALQAQGIVVWCIHLGAAHDETVRSIYGQRYTVVDQVQRLPEVLTTLFMSLTK